MQSGEGREGREKEVKARAGEEVEAQCSAVVGIERNGNEGRQGDV